nr:hypothetical protein [Tanacetum cinerariifolium]
MDTSTVPLPPPPINPSSHLTTIAQQQTPDSTTTTTNPTMSLPEIPNFAEEAEVENQEFFDQVDSTIKTIIKEQVKAQVSKIMPRIEKYVTESLGADVLVRHSKNLYNALVEAYNLDKDIITSYGDVVTLKRAYVINRLKIDNLAQEILVRRTFNMLKGTCKSFAEHEYHFKECYKVVNDKLDWNNPEGHTYPFDLSKTLPLIEDRGRQVVPADYFINNDLGDYIQRDDNVLHKFKEGDFPRLNMCDIEDMLLLLVQKKLSNLDIDDRLMRSDKLYKFYDETLSSVRTVLHDIASSLEMNYLPKKHWSNLENQRSRIMIKAIDKLLFERRLMRDLEKFVGGREYGIDLGLLERII